jgi:uncharacterized protein YpbB
MEGFRFATRGVAKYSKKVAVEVANVTATMLELLHLANGAVPVIIRSFAMSIVYSLATSYNKAGYYNFNIANAHKLSKWICWSAFASEMINLLAEPLYRGLRSITNK